MKAAIVDIKPVSVAVLQQKFMHKTMMQSGDGAGSSFPIPVLSVKFHEVIPEPCSIPRIYALSRKGL